MDDLDPKFVRKREGLHATSVPAYKKPKKGQVPVSSKYKYRQVILKIPDEYAFALMDMCEGRGLQYSIMNLIKKHVVPVSQDG